MKRIAFKMKLKSGAIAEYKRRHDAIWPEVKELLKKSGVSDYHIYLDNETDTLFATQVVSGDGGSQDLGSEEIIRKWWDYMAEFMETNDDNSPVSDELQEIFYME